MHGSNTRCSPVMTSVRKPRSVRSCSSTRRDVCEKEQHRLQRFDLLVLLELLAAVVGCRAIAQDFDQDRWIVGDQGARGIRAQLAAHDRDVRIRRKPSGEHPYPQVRTEDSTGPASELRDQRRADGHRQRCMLRGAPRHGVNLAVEELMLDVGRGLQIEVIAKRVAMIGRGRDESSG